jgi:UDP-N-acetylmuramate dehydrogenase
MTTAVSIAPVSAGLAARNPVEVLPLAGLTTMRVGGPATVVTVHDRADLAELLDRPHRWLGRGANLLVADAGVPELVVRLGAPFAGIAAEDAAGRVRLRVGAATDLAELIGFCTRGGLAGPEGLAGVPATVGGALRMNAGTAHCWILDFVARVEVVLPGEGAPRWIERAEMPAAYRTCGLPPGTLFLGCELELGRGDPEALRARAAQLKKAKAATQPLALPSAGCVFKNPAPDMPAGRLIDELGLKGARIGGACVSPVHANFIVNDRRSAAADDVADLVRWIRRTAWDERGVELRMEVETWAMPDDLRAHPRDLTIAREPMREVV